MVSLDLRQKVAAAVNWAQQNKGKKKQKADQKDKLKVEEKKPATSMFEEEFEYGIGVCVCNEHTCSGTRLTCLDRVQLALVDARGVRLYVIFCLQYVQCEAATIDAPQDCGTRSSCLSITRSSVPICELTISSSSSSSSGYTCEG